MTYDEVRLTSAELCICAQLGVLRQVAAIQGDLKDKHGFEGDGWGIHIEGACGEYAYCKSQNIYWCPTINTFRKQADVGKSEEVKTRSRHDYDLLIRPDDVLDRNFILVTGQAPLYRVHGWYPGKEAIRDEWRHEYGGRPAAWFVPQSHLRPLSELHNERALAA